MRPCSLQTSAFEANDPCFLTRKIGVTSTCAMNGLPVAVIGGGPVGLATAAHLLSQEMSVKLYEAGQTAAIPAKVSESDRAMVTAGLAKDVEAVNQYAEVM
jgi:hypothetical protein